MQNRIVSLDSLRGIAACLIALLHFDGVTSARIPELANISNLWLYTDFFFVLSGFVIATKYEHRLHSGGDGVLWFLLRRLGRLYPLHVAILALFLLRAGAHVAAHWAGLPVGPISPEDWAQSAAYLPVNLLMWQGFPHLQSFYWNRPSWAVGAEFYVYVVFVGLVVFSGRRTWVALIGCALAASLASGMLYAQWETPIIDIYVEFGLLRCLCAFCVGALASHAYRAGMLRATAWREAGAVLFVVVFALVAPEAVVLNTAPYLLGVLVVLLAQETGFVSRVLRIRPLVWLAPLSYAIYLSNDFVGTFIGDTLVLSGRLLGIPLFELAREVDAWMGDAITLGYLAAVIGFSWIIHRFVEVPARDYSRRLADRLFVRQSRLPDAQLSARRTPCEGATSSS